MESYVLLNSIVLLELLLNFHVLQDIMMIEKVYQSVSFAQLVISVLGEPLSLKFVLPPCIVLQV